MTFKPVSRRTSFVVTLGVFFSLSACAILEPSKPEDQVRQRATERWQALVKGEFIRAYEYNTPGFKAVVTPDGFRNRFGGAVTWVRAEVIGVNCPDVNKCVSSIKLEFKPALAMSFGTKEPLTNYLDETWLREEGQWWFFQKI